MCTLCTDSSSNALDNFFVSVATFLLRFLALKFRAPAGILICIISRSRFRVTLCSLTMLPVFDGIGKVPRAFRFPSPTQRHLARVVTCFSDGAYAASGT